MSTHFLVLPLFVPLVDQWRHQLEELQLEWTAVVSEQDFKSDPMSQTQLELINKNV